MTDRRIAVRGTTLYVDDRGAEDAPALLYAHGGPGQSCYDFMQVQGDRLAERVRLIGVDQRGILRSDPLSPGETVTAATIVEDYEALRAALGIGSWVLLAASAGAGPGLDYAVGHPDAVSAAVFDCPAWDGDLTERNRLPVAAELLDRYGAPEAASRCRELAAKSERIDAADDARGLLRALGEHYLEIYFHDREAAAAFDRIWEVFDEEDPQRSASHQPLAAEIYVSRLPALASLRVPSLLVRGEHDLITAPAVVERYLADARDARVHTISGAGHFPSHERPDEYAAVVTEFVLAHGQGSR
jgi:proline iminopeptidase